MPVVQSSVAAVTSSGMGTTIGNATQHGSLKALTAMRSHHNEVSSEIARQLHDLLGGITLAHDRLDLQTPQLQLRRNPLQVVARPLDGCVLLRQRWSSDYARQRD